MVVLDPPPSKRELSLAASVGATLLLTLGATSGSTPMPDAGALPASVHAGTAAVAEPQQLAPKPRIAKAVEAGLVWLARHQSADGSWGHAALEQRCSAEAKCYGAKSELVPHFDEGLTGLALLCFLREGRGPASKEKLVDPLTQREYVAGEIVARGLGWLRSVQKPTGAFGRTQPFMYNHAIATLAMIEAWRAGKDDESKQSALRGVEYLQGAQKPNPSGAGLWGWRYASRQDIEAGREKADPDAFAKDMADADMSVTSWAVLTLQAAKDAGLPVQEDCIRGALAFFEFAVGRDACVGYVESRGAGVAVSGPHDEYEYHCETMSALGLHVVLAAAADPKGAFGKRVGERLLAEFRTFASGGLSVDYYYWFHGTLALDALQRGAKGKLKQEKAFKPWYAATLDTLLRLQDATPERCSLGGWIQQDRWSHYGGPVYCTATAVLTLQLERAAF